MADSFILVVKKIANMVMEYTIEKYQEGHTFMYEEHREHQESEFDEFLEDLFDNEEHNFHEYMIECGMKLTTEEITKMSNWVKNREKFKNTKVDLDMTEKKIVNKFASCCAYDDRNIIFDKLRFMYCDDEEEEEEEEEV